MRPLLIAALSLAMAGLPAVEAQAEIGAAAEPLGMVAAPVTKRVAIVMIQNGSTDTARTQLADTAFIRNIFFGSANSLAAWMPAVTHGLLSYVPAGDGIFLTEPNDALRNGSPTGCHSVAARDTAEDHLAALGVQWDSVGVVFDIGGCEWGGLGQMPGRITWYPPRPSLSAIVHEFGHNQGYPHEAKRDCASAQMSACTAKDYSGNTPMGSGGAGKGYSSVELLHSGWVEPGWLTQANKPGIFSLKPLYSPTSVSGTRVVEYKASATLTYVIEIRAPSGAIDTAISNPGVRVYAVNGRDFKNAWLVNPGAHRSA
ncbi:MAG TPA: hypothetical protein DGG94_19155, partial [Micromonosporaceae bacterium]|nr:hypothetical protein [Micromonosporaceae bacterium]